MLWIDVHRLSRRQGAGAYSLGVHSLIDNSGGDEAARITYQALSVHHNVFSAFTPLRPT
ncbi:hypothetical protein CGLAMM_10270 [Acetobacteraceae bacterium EV16G]|uniref:Uncharacterized protein n=1 Tax=Sorlinia euscelidii TaxID=3081148 RepID=A0ABU7U1R8_9PROT